jgi:hypothetical protein
MIIDNDVASLNMKIVISSAAVKSEKRYKIRKETWNKNLKFNKFQTFFK